jgi:hypothetical protein
MVKTCRSAFKELVQFVGEKLVYISAIAIVDFFCHLHGFRTTSITYEPAKMKVTRVFETSGSLTPLLNLTFQKARIININAVETSISHP